MHHFSGPEFATLADNIEISLKNTEGSFTFFALPFLSRIIRIFLQGSRNRVGSHKMGQRGYIPSAKKYKLVLISFAIVYSTRRGYFSFRMLFIKGELSKTLMSFALPGIPKNRCHIHNLSSATAYMVSVGTLSLPVSCPDQAVGQFFHLHFEQSIEPILPGNQRSRLRAKFFHVSLAVGIRRYSSLNTSITDLVKRSIETSKVDSAILKYWSKESAAVPNASICRHAQMFCSEESPRTPKSVLFL
jgi:hypothetical protein